MTMSTWSSPPLRVVLLSNQSSLCLTEAAPAPADSILDVDSPLVGKEESNTVGLAIIRLEHIS